MLTMGTWLTFLLPRPAMKHSSPTLVQASLLSSFKGPLIPPPHFALAVLYFLLVSFMILACFVDPVDRVYPPTTPHVSVLVWLTQPPCSSPGLTFPQEHSHN